MSVALAASAVSVRRGRREVVRDVSVELTRGEVVAFLGPNGAGKSTLVEALGGLLPVASGAIDRDGRVATVLQSPGLARRSVRANVELALAWWGVPRGQRRTRAGEALERMRASHLSSRPAGALSGGERRRVHLARGLAVNPDVLLLDEPFAGLDAESHRVLCEDTATAVRDAGSAVGVVLHERADAWTLADRVLVLMGGRVAASGGTADVLSNPPTAEVATFLGFDGQVAGADGTTLFARAGDVRLVTEGGLEGTVVRRFAQEDGLLLEVAVASGRVRCRTTENRVVGDVVRVEIVGGARF